MSLSTQLTASALDCLCDYYTRKGGGVEALQGHIDLAAEELAAGVTITSVSFEGSGNSGVSNRTPQEMLDILGQVQRAMEGRQLRDEAQGNFRNHRIET